MLPIAFKWLQAVAANFRFNPAAERADCSAVKLYLFFSSLGISVSVRPVFTSLEYQEHRKCLIGLQRKVSEGARHTVQPPESFSCWILLTRQLYRQWFWWLSSWPPLVECSDSRRPIRPVPRIESSSTSGCQLPAHRFSWQAVIPGAQCCVSANSRVGRWQSLRTIYWDSRYKSQAHLHASSSEPTRRSLKKN